ncbi:MAG: methyltransferase domain-containing protein [Lewinella sp.]|nr:methyltransferase domain-containing protein [Lewinella sp.]
MQPLNQRIKQFYDRSTDLWLRAWGDHMHHGYYGPDGQSTIDHRQAQLSMIEALLDWGQAPAQPLQILDAGCGVGASSRYLLSKYPEAKALGLTLSPVQVGRGTQLNLSAGMGSRCTLRAQDVYTLDPAKDGPFDLIWSMESAEHMGDKAGLFRLFAELLAPGGTLLMATWLHRPTPPALLHQEVTNLNKISKHYHLPPWTSLPALSEAAAKAGLVELRTADWSAAVAPFWKAVIRAALQPSNWGGLLRSGPGTLAGAWAMRYMQRGFRQGTIQYGVLRASKPGD